MTDTAIVPFEIDREAVLKVLNLSPRDPKTHALLLVCEQYHLDPLLKHMVLVSGNPYITRDGLLHNAHRSGQFDGMEVLDQYETDTHHVAKVAVYRKDMGRPFTYVGRFPKSKPMAKEYGPEMAVKVAEVMALRRAFDVTGVGVAEERWDIDADVSHDERPALVQASPAEIASAEAHQLLRDAIGELAIELQRELVSWWNEQGLPSIKDEDRLSDAQIEAAEAKIDALDQVARDGDADKERALKALMIEFGKAFPCTDAPKGQKTRMQTALRHAVQYVVLGEHRSATTFTLDEIRKVDSWLHREVVEHDDAAFETLDDGTVRVTSHGQTIDVPPVPEEQAA